MQEYSKALGDAVKRARGKQELTQRSVADSIDVDVRTIINIENNRGNPKLKALYALVRKLKIDPREIFYPETKLEDPAKRRIRLLIEDCDEDEAAALAPVFEAMIAAMRSSKGRILK